ncbi:hypothetical protein EB118_02840 [bacterium]|nr:hypothetical protein [Actinomycetota bacterium]NDG29020.1 hypothetical protein [bacterium]
MSQEEIFDPEDVFPMSNNAVMRIIDSILATPAHSSDPDRPQIFTITRDGGTRVELFNLLKDRPVFKKTGVDEEKFTGVLNGNFRGFYSIELNNRSLTEKEKIMLAVEIIEALTKMYLWPPALDDYDRIALAKWEAANKAFERRGPLLAARSRARRAGKRKVRKTHKRSRS